MEYTRKNPLSNEMHFGSVKQHNSFHVPKYVGPFQMRSLSVVQYLEGFLEQLRLEKAEAMAYDPHGVISK